VVTDIEGQPIENVSVSVNDEEAGRTDSDGRIDVTVPGGEELEIEVSKGDREGELEVEIES
jgi:hypothetical protein